MIDPTLIRALPKVSLHDHLDGGIRPSTLIELCCAAQVPVPTTDPEELGRLILAKSRSGSLPEYLSSFALVGAALQTADALERVAREFVADLTTDGVIYAEVRWAPSAHTRGALSMDDAVDAVQRGIDQGKTDAGRRGHDIRVEQLLTALRHEDGALATAELAIHRRGRGVVGFDIAGPEVGYGLDPHRAALDLLAHECLPCTVHAGEADGVESIHSAIVDGHALRLGHGVRIAEDITVQHREGAHVRAILGPVAAWVRDRQIALELSPTSNLQTGAVAAWGSDLAHHPFDLLYRLGFAVTVNVDNRTMSATTLCRELELLAGAFEYGIDDLVRFQLTAAASAFLPQPERRALVARIEEHPIPSQGAPV
jgi:adenosine deaminase